MPIIEREIHNVSIIRNIRIGQCEPFGIQIRYLKMDMNQSPPKVDPFVDVFIMDDYNMMTIMTWNGHEMEYHWTGYDEIELYEKLMDALGMEPF